MRDALDLDVAQLDGFGLRGDLLCLLTDVLQHLLGRCGQRIRAQAAQVLGFEVAHVKHGRIVQSQHRRGHWEMFRLPLQY